MDTGAAVMIGLFAFLTVSAWASSRREQREMEYRYELYRRMVEHPGPEAEAVRALLEKDARDRNAATISKERVGGLVVLAVAIGFGTFLYFIAPGKPIYLLALVPGLVGLVIVMNGFALARRLRARGGNAGEDGGA